MDQFFECFSEGYFLQTVRDIKATAASMKNYSYLVLGSVLSTFDHSFTQRIVERWLIALYFGVKNRLKYTNKYHIISYERLVLDSENYLKNICESIEIEFDKNMLTPKYGNSNWSGNSSFGEMPSVISNKSLKKYQEVLTEEEIHHLDQESKQIIDCYDNSTLEETLELLEFKLKHMLNWADLEYSQLRDYFNMLHSDLRKKQLNVNK